MSEDRVRGRSRRSNRVRGTTVPHFVNPYPWMSSDEARVHLELERRRVPFMWRFFDGDSPHLKALLPDYAPEFTLKEYKVVIIVIGGFFGTLPGPLDRNALAQVLLEADGWKFVSLTEHDIYTNLSDTIDKALPELVSPAIVGPPRLNPYGQPDFMTERRQRLAQLALQRRQFKLDKQEEHARGRKRRRTSSSAGPGDRTRSRSAQDR